TVYQRISREVPRRGSNTFRGISTSRAAGRTFGEWWTVSLKHWVFRLQLIAWIAIRCPRALRSSRSRSLLWIMLWNGGSHFEYMRRDLREWLLQWGELFTNRQVSRRRGRTSRST